MTITSASAVVVVAGLATAIAVRTDGKLDRVDRVEVRSLAATEPAPTEPFTALVVGSDRRTDPLDAADEAVTGARTDSMVLVRVEADEQVRVLPLPRDLWVDIPGHGPNRLNAAYSLGGADLLTRTIGADLGVSIDRYVELDFAGTRAIADAIGGLRLAFPAPVRDRSTGLALDAGCQDLDGATVLALARSRHLQQQAEDGSWRSDPTSDLGRMERQQAIGVAAIAALSHIDRGSPRQLDELLEVIARNLIVDSRTSNGELLGLFRSIAGTPIVALRLPVTDAVHDGAMVLERTPAATAALAALDAADPAGTTTTAPPATGSVPTTTEAPAPGPASTVPTGAVVPTTC